MTKFSIITVTYNCANLIEDTILSVVKQDFSDYEYIIIDGGSTDGTINIINKYIKYIKYFISEKDNGLYDALNKGIEIANGNIIGLIHAGDKYFDHTLFEVNKFSEFDIITGGMIKYNNDYEFIIHKQKFNSINYLYAMPFNHPSTFVKKKIYNKYGLFDTKFKLVADSDFFLRLYFYNLKIAKTKIILSKMLIGGRSEDINNIFIMALEHFYKRKKYSINVFLNYFLFIKYCLIRYTKSILFIILPKLILKKYYNLK